MRQKHKVYRRSTAEEQQAMVEAYAAGSTQVELAVRFDMTQVAVSQILRRHGVEPRQGAVANPVTFDVDRAELLYVAGFSGADVAEMIGISPGVLLSHLRRRGVTRPRKVHTYARNAAFFSTLAPERAYWAGFLAADGCVYKGRIVVGLHPDDVDMLEKFKIAADCANPIYRRKNTTGREYVYLEVSCKEWAADLERLYRVTPKKSLTLQPPNLSEPLRWAFARGYFDGDGHASREGEHLQVTCGSKVFLEWLVREVMGAHHAVSPQNGAWGCTVTGPVFRSVVQKLYEGSTPATRMARKYDRFDDAGRFDVPSA